jgi:hypothetical protein
VENRAEMWYIEGVLNTSSFSPFMVFNDDPPDRICGVFVVYPVKPGFRFGLMTGDYFRSSKQASQFLGRQSDVLGKRLRQARGEKDTSAVLNGILFVTAKNALASNWKRLRVWAEYRLRDVLKKQAEPEAKQKARAAKANGANLLVGSDEIGPRISGPSSL